MCRLINFNRDFPLNFVWVFTIASAQHGISIVKIHSKNVANEQNSTALELAKGKGLS